jgi:hypothetical protein
MPVAAAPPPAYSVAWGLASGEGKAGTNPRPRRTSRWATGSRRTTAPPALSASSPACSGAHGHLPRQFRRSHICLRRCGGLGRRRDESHCSKRCRGHPQDAGSWRRRPRSLTWNTAVSKTHKCPGPMGAPTPGQENHYLRWSETRDWTA